MVPSHFDIIVISINSYQTNFSNIESKLYTHFFAPIPFLPAFALTLHCTPNKHIQLKFKILKMQYYYSLHSFIIFKHLFGGHSINKITINHHHKVNPVTYFFFRCWVHVQSSPYRHTGTVLVHRAIASISHESATGTALAHVWVHALSFMTENRTSPSFFYTLLIRIVNIPWHFLQQWIKVCHSRCKAWF